MLISESLLRDALRLVVWYPVRWIIIMLPVPAGIAVLKAMGTIHFLVSSGKRALIRNRLVSLQAKGLVNGDIDRHAREYFRNHYVDRLIIFLFPKFDRTAIDRLVEFEGLENLDTALAGRKGVITTAEYPGSHWALPVSKDLIKATENHFADTNLYPTDSRGVAYSYAFFSPKHLGAGQYYLFAIRDKDGNAFDGANSYRLHVPPNVPVKQYWSVTAYDRATHGLIRDTKWSSRSSQTRRPAKKCRWLGRYLLRVSTAGREGIELGPDQREWQVRSALPFLRAGEGALR